MDPGLGKTSIVLDAFARLKATGAAKRMLVIAPLRVCQTVWRQEAAKWSDFRDLKFSLLHGDKKAERLKDDADIFLINPEGVKWLGERFFGRPLPFDTVTIDELTKFKNHSAERSKALRPRLRTVTRRWGLTGSPAPNGYMDLFGQLLMLDDGAALGRYVTHYRDKYFQAGYDGFSYDLQPGGGARIEEAIRPYVLRMSAEEYLELPPLVDDIRELDMETAARKTYNTMKKDMLATLPEGVVTGANAAAVYSKLKQMANGAVYINDAHDVSHLHDTKLEALDELVEELSGQQLLIGYEFQHDLQRLKDHFGDRLQNIGSGAGETKTAQIVDAWNSGKIQLLACHPASAAHGLNLQYGGCSHLCWFSPTWDLELYQQFIRRIYRQGTKAPRVVNHILCVKDTIDGLALSALRDKDTTQSKLLRGLNNEILTQGDGMSSLPETRIIDMQVAKLSRQADAAGGGAPQRVVPKGWGPKAAGGAATQTTAAVHQLQPNAKQIDAEPVQTDIEDVTGSTAHRARIQEKLEGGATVVNRDPEPVGYTSDSPPSQSLADKARAAFSRTTQEAREAMESGNTPTFHDKGSQDAWIERQKAAQEPAQEETQATAIPSAKRKRGSVAASVDVLGGEVTISPEIRLGVLQLAIAHTDTIATALQVAEQMVEFLKAA